MKTSRLALTALAVLTLCTTTWAACWQGTPPQVTLSDKVCHNGAFGAYCNSDTGSNGSSCSTTTIGSTGCSNYTPSLNKYKPVTDAAGHCTCQNDGSNGTVTGGIPTGNVCKPA